MKPGGRFSIQSLGVIFALFGCLMLDLNLQVITHGAKLEGIVVGSESRGQDTRGIPGHTDAPVIEFQVQGETLRIPSRMSSAWHGLDPGERVTLYLDSANPEEVILESPYHMFRFGSLFLGFGAAWHSSQTYWSA